MVDTLVIPVHGMSCSGCVGSVKRALSGAVGVIEVVDVSLDGQSATLTFDPAQTDRARLAQVIEDAGYESPL